MVSRGIVGDSGGASIRPAPALDHVVPIEERFDLPPSADTLAVLRALQQAVDEALYCKRLLGQYAVVWEGGRVVVLPPEALPSRPPSPASRKPRGGA